MVIIIITIVTSRAPPRNISHPVQSGVVVGGDGGGGGAGGGSAGAGVASGGDCPVVKAEVALQALWLPEPVALTFQ